MSCRMGSASEYWMANSNNLPKRELMIIFKTKQITLTFTALGFNPCRVNKEGWINFLSMFLVIHAHSHCSTRSGIISQGFFHGKAFQLSFPSFCLSLIYFCNWSRTKDVAEPRRLLRLMRCWFLLILWPKEVVHMFLVFDLCLCLCLVP